MADDELLLRAQRFDVIRRGCATAEGSEVHREFVVHPGAVVILGLLDGNAEGRQVVMIHNYRHAVERELLELPAGTLEPGEEPLHCAVREFEEETGYRAAHIEPLAQFYVSPGILTERMHVYVATDLSEGCRNLDDGEHIRVEPMPLADAYARIADGAIQDAKTIAALLLYRMTQERR